jgi:hypothetical protein
MASVAAVGIPYGGLVTGDDAKKMAMLSGNDDCAACPKLQE